MSTRSSLAAAAVLTLAALGQYRRRPAGRRGMSRRRLLRFSAVGVGVWGGGLIVAGCEFAGSVGQTIEPVGNVALAIAGGLVLWAALRQRRGRFTPCG